MSVNSVCSIVAFPSVWYRKYGYAGSLMIPCTRQSVIVRSPPCRIAVSHSPIIQRVNVVVKSVGFSRLSRST